MEQELTKDRGDIKKLLDKEYRGIYKMRMIRGNKQRDQNSINPDLVINCDGFNPLTKVLAALMSPKWVVGGYLSKNLKRDGHR